MISIVLSLPLLGAAPAAELSLPSASPHEAVLAQVRALRNDDVAGLIRSFVTDAQFEEMKAAWEAERQRTPDPTEDAEFTAFLERFGAPGAEKALWPEVEAGLAELRPQLGMMTMMFSGMAESAIQDEANLTDEDRERALAVVGAIQETLSTNDLTDPGLAREALGIVCETVRSLGVSSLEDVYALDFEQLLARAGLALRGVKELLAIYGFEINGWLSSFSAETVHTDGDYAVVRIKFSMLGMDESSEVEMTRIAGRWFQKDTTEGTALLGK